MRISRPCYDKYRRCPGWAGGGMRYAKTERCNNGIVNTYTPNGDRRILWRWRCHRCDTCGVLVLPCHVAKIDPTAWRSHLRRRRDRKRWLKEGEA